MVTPSSSPREAGVEHLLARLEDQGIFRMVFAVDAVGVEQALHVDRQGEVVVLLLDGLHQRLAFAGAAGVQLEQAVATAVQFRFEGFATARPSASSASRPCPRRRRAAAAGEAELVLQGVAGGTGIEEGVQRLVVPLERRCWALFSRCGTCSWMVCRWPIRSRRRCAARAGPGGPAGRTAPGGGRTGSCGLRCRFPSRSAPGRRTLRRRSRRRRGRARECSCLRGTPWRRCPNAGAGRLPGRGPSRRGHR